jgi:hypothetical protein
MSVVLRIILFVGLIFWFSPLRSELEKEPKGPKLDLDRIGRLIDWLGAVPAEERARVAERFFVLGANTPGVGRKTAWKTPEPAAPSSVGKP